VANDPEQATGVLERQRESDSIVSDVGMRFYLVQRGNEISSCSTWERDFILFNVGMRFHLVHRQVKNSPPQGDFILFIGKLKTRRHGEISSCSTAR